MDRYGKATRSRVMARIKKADTGLERALLTILDSWGLEGFIRYPEGLAGHPDVVFEAQRVALFVDSCFWHGCSQHCRMPKTNVDYWRNKIEANKERDKRQTAELRSKGWRVFRIWEHELRDPAKLEERLRELALALASASDGCR